MSVAESDIFKKIQQRTDVVRGDLLAFVRNRERFSRLMRSTLLGVTTWFNAGILMMLAPEFGVAKGIAEPVSAAMAVVWFHAGIVSGDVASGLYSQYLRSRLKAMRVFLTLQAVLVVVYLFVPMHAAWHMYLTIMLLGFSGGFWAVFITNATEQFGANLRATAACTVPSIVRLCFVPMALAFQWLKAPWQLNNTLYAAAVVGTVCLTLAFWASFGLKDTFDADLDFVEN